MHYSDWIHKCLKRYSENAVAFPLSRRFAMQKFVPSHFTSNSCQARHFFHFNTSLRLDFTVLAQSMSIELYIVPAMCNMPACALVQILTFDYCALITLFCAAQSQWNWIKFIRVRVKIEFLFPPRMRTMKDDESDLMSEMPLRWMNIYAEYEERIHNAQKVRSKVRTDSANN